MQTGWNWTSQFGDNANQIIRRHLLIFALLFSLAWHFFSICSFRVFVGRAPVTAESYTDISFIGAILQDEPVLLESGEGTAERDAESGRIERAIPAGDILRPDAADYNYLEKPVFAADFDVIEELSNKVKGIEELTGKKQFAQKFFDYVKVSYKARPFEIEGPARFREIIYKPALPDRLRWDEGLGVNLNRLGNSFKMELKFWVTAEGNVEMVERVSSSGHPTIDLVGMRYLKGWRFAPLTAAKEEDDERWGVIKLDLNLVKAPVE